MIVNEIDPAAGTATITLDAAQLRFIASALSVKINRAVQRNRSCARMAERYAAGDPRILEDNEPFPERNERHIRMNNAAITKGGGLLKEFDSLLTEFNDGSNL